MTVSGSQELVNQAGPFTGDIEVPAGPGFVTDRRPRHLVAAAVRRADINVGITDHLALCVSV